MQCMLTPESPSTRPSRLPALGQLAIALLLFGSFVSGVLIWWGKTVQAHEMVTPGWLRPAFVLHGALNPLLCMLFGYLLCHHIRVGWQLRANLLTGFLMEGVFVGLILTGVGMYYLGEE